MKKTYVVVQHSTGNGYVVRTAYDGWLPAPYTNSERKAEYQREGPAERLADKLNGH